MRNRQTITKRLTLQAKLLAGKNVLASKKHIFTSANPSVRKILQRWDGIERFMKNIHAQTRASDEAALEIVSWFIPAGQLTKLRYLKFAAVLFKSKRGIVVLKFGENLTMELSKNIIANRGEIANVDISDVLLNTITKVAGIYSKIGAKVFNSMNDFSYEKGAIFLLLLNKDQSAIGTDLLFNPIKLGVG